jgi:tetratricopeptide (TPR) repeat protein
VILAQVEQAVQQIPLNPSQSMRLVILQRLAATYAQAGNYTKAKEIAAKLPKNSEAQSIALRGIVEAYITEQKLENAEQLTEAIGVPSQKVIALGQLATAYDNAKQPVKAIQRFRQAVQLAKSPAIARDATSQELLIKGLVQNYLKAGQRNEARQLAQTDLKVFQKEAFKAVVLADGWATRSRQAIAHTTISQHSK